MPMSAVQIRGSLLIVVAVGLTFSNSLHEVFHFDDQHSLVANPHIRQLGAVPDFFVDPQLFSRNIGSEMYRPLVLISYALTYEFFGGRAGPYHFGNIAIHLLVALVVYTLYLRLGLEQAGALAGALLFAIHPLVTEPVNYVSSRSESLAALFFLVGLWSYLGRGSWALLGALGSFAAALMTKSSVIVLPLVLVAYEVWIREVRSPLRWRRVLPFGALAAIYFWGTWRLVHEAVVAAPVRGWAEQLGTQLKALVYYLKLLFFPHPLSVEHPFSVAESSIDLVLASVLALLVTLAYLLWRARHLRPLLFWLSWIAITLLPTSLVPLNVLVNERRLYLPLVAAVGIGIWLVQNRCWGPYLRYGVLVLSLGLMSMAHQRNIVWRSEKSLWEDARTKAPQMVRPHVQLGAIYRAEGDFSAAADSYALALEIDPNHAPTHNNIGNLYRATNDHSAAEAAYVQALELLPEYPDALINLATLHSDQGRFAEALPLYQRALALGRQRIEVYNNLGTAYLKMEDFARAESVLREGLALGAERPGLYFNLGGALEGQGQLVGAMQAYRRALQIDSTYARAHYNLALLHEGAGERIEAIEDYRAFIRHWRGAARFSQQAKVRLGILEERTP